jgi:RNA polymerase sigma-70 factor (ECF subfamily)
MADINILIERCQAGDEWAAEALYNNFRDSTFRLAFGLLNHWDEAEEVTQDSLVYALTNIRRYDPRRARFSTWLHTITICRCRNKRRVRQGIILSLTAWLSQGKDVPDPTPDQECQAVKADLQSEVWQAIQQLSPLLREAILLRHWAGHTCKEIAEIMACPLPTAQSRLRLAHQHLRHTLSSSQTIGLGDLEEGSVR